MGAQTSDRLPSDVDNVSESPTLTVIERVQDHLHIPSQDCKCQACHDDRGLLGCKNPHACATAVERKLSRLLPKWDPRRSQRAVLDTADVSVSSKFKPPSEITTLTDGFRVFTLGSQSGASPPTRRRARDIPELRATKLNIFLGSMTKRNDRREIVAGGGV
ncbi:hypothetical protein B0H13DRAFT_1633639 [Mycena leptocephala]|nr:hypothetical protein B0H13DRAFT_1633639 [Mycena leptocephala]